MCQAFTSQNRRNKLTPIYNIQNKQYFNYTDSKFYKLLSNYDRYDEVNPITTLSRQYWKTLYAANPDIKYIPAVTNGIVKDYPYPSKSPINNTELRLNGQQRFNFTSDQTTGMNYYLYPNNNSIALILYFSDKVPNK